MTVRELIQHLELLDPAGCQEVRVRAVGGIGRSAVPIKGAHIGFDWDHGSVIINPDPPLAVYRPHKREGARL